MIMLKLQRIFRRHVILRIAAIQKKLLQSHLYPIFANQILKQLMETNCSEI